MTISTAAVALTTALAKPNYNISKSKQAHRLDSACSSGVMFQHFLPHQLTHTLTHTLRDIHRVHPEVPRKTLFATSLARSLVFVLPWRSALSSVGSSQFHQIT